MKTPILLLALILLAFTSKSQVSDQCIKVQIIDTVEIAYDISYRLSGMNLYEARDSIGIDSLNLIKFYYIDENNNKKYLPWVFRDYKTSPKGIDHRKTGF